MRGQLGTEHLTAIQSAADADFLLLDQAVTKLPWTSDKADVLLSYRLVPAGKPISYNWAVNKSYAGQQTALKPFAPVHLKALQLDNGDVSVSWIRRTRWEGDSWATAEVPLQEEELKFSLMLRHQPANASQALVLQTYATTEEAIILPRLDLSIHLPSGTHSLIIEVAQASIKFGSGTPAKCTLDIVL